MYWPDLGKVQEIGDMNIVSQMCAIAVMFVIMYFIFRRKRLYYIHRRLLLRYGLQACCHFSLIFSHLLQLKKEADILILLPILSANYISGRLHGLPWWPSGIYAWIFSGKRA